MNRCFKEENCFGTHAFIDVKKVKKQRFHETLTTFTWLLLANRESRNVASPVTLFANVDTFFQTSFAFLSAILHFAREECPSTPQC